MNDKIFRKKSIDKITSPEQLDSYIRVTNPGMWMFLLGIVIILVGICIWGVFGKIDTKLTVPVVSQDGVTVCYLKADEAEKAETGMPVEIDGKQYTISEISSQPVEVDDTFAEYTVHIGNFKDGEWVYMAKLSDTIPEGIYEAEIVVESISPISFIIN